MRNTLKHIGYALWVIGLLLVTVPTMAQQEQWRSTSTIHGTISYTAPVTVIGATSAPSIATTTSDSYSPAKAPSGPRRGFDTGAETGQSSESPIGDALIPLSLMALIYALVMYFRRRKEERKKTL